MPPNRPIARDVNQDRSEVLKQIRINVAFEQMILAVLTGAVIGGGLIFVLGFAGAIVGGGLSPSQLLAVTLKAITISFLIFLTGFFSSAAVMTPLFWAMEKAKRRNVWPYLAASLVVAILAFLLATGETPFTAKNTPEALSATIVPAIVIALIFGRRMEPYWRASAQAEAAAKAGAIVTFH